VGSALFMALFRSLLRAFAGQVVARKMSAPQEQHPSAPGPAAEPLASRRAERITQSAVERTHNYVYQNHGWQSMFCTLFFGVLDTSTGSLTYINAGHEAPALIGAAGIRARLTRTGPSVGWHPNPTFRSARVFLEPGDILFGYTDGVTEA